jgi:hypothetical protein
MKRKSPGRLKSELRKKLLPEIDLPTLAHEIIEFSNTLAGKATQGSDFANMLAAYLARKYSIADRKNGELGPLIEHNSDDLATFLDERKFQTLLRAFKPKPTSIQDSLLGLLNTPEKAQSSQKDLRRKKKRRARPKTESERLRRRKASKDDYEWRRGQYRRGLIVQEFGMYPFSTLSPEEETPPEGPCLDVLFRGESVRMAAESGSLEDLFGLSRKRFPKLLRPKRNGRTTKYYLNDFTKCMVSLLANRDGKEPWLPRGAQRDLVLRGITARARHISSDIADNLAKKLRRFLS